MNSNSNSNSKKKYTWIFIIRNPHVTHMDRSFFLLYSIIDSIDILNKQFFDFFPSNLNNEKKSHFILLSILVYTKSYIINLVRVWTRKINSNLAINPEMKKIIQLIPFSENRIRIHLIMILNSIVCLSVRLTKIKNPINQ